MFFYASALRLRYKYPKVKRPYEVPGKTIGMWIAVVVGMLSSIFVFFISFWPPPELPEESAFFFVSFLVVGIVVMTGIPIFIYHCKGKWSNKKIVKK